MVENAVFWINALPINSGMSSTISPADVHDRDHHRFQQTLQNRSWRIRQGTLKNFPTKLDTITHRSRYMSRTNRKPPRFPLVPQPPHRTSHQTTYLHPSSRPNARYGSRSRAPRCQQPKSCSCFIALEIPSLMVTPLTTKIRTTTEISQEWRNVTAINMKSQE